MGKRLDQAIAEADEIERADADPDAPIPGHVTVSRPGRARSRVLQVRLNPDELEALEAIAERRGLPVSTVAREQLLAMIDSGKAADTVTGLLRKMSFTVSELERAHAAEVATKVSAHR